MMVVNKILTKIEKDKKKNLIILVKSEKFPTELIQEIKKFIG